MGGGGGPRVLAAREPITLGQALKLADLAGSGGEAKLLIAEGLVSVNGVVEGRRGRKLSPGDLVSVEGTSFRLVTPDDDTTGSPTRERP